MSEKGRTAEGSRHTHVSVAVAAGQVQGRVAVVVLHVRAGFVVQQQQLREERGKQVSRGASRVGPYGRQACATQEGLGGCMSPECVGAGGRELLAGQSGVGRGR